MYVNCQGALAIKIWPGIFILKNCEVHQNQKNGTKQPNGYILSAYNKINIVLNISIYFQCGECYNKLHKITKNEEDHDEIIQENCKCYTVN